MIVVVVGTIRQAYCNSWVLMTQAMFVLVVMTYLGFQAQISYLPAVEPCCIAFPVHMTPVTQPRLECSLCCTCNRVLCLQPAVSNILVAGTAGLGEVEGQEFMAEPNGSVEELIDSMSCAFYSLAATGTVRVGRLCKGPQLLACWALELLEEQACHVCPSPSNPSPLPPVDPRLLMLRCLSVLCNQVPASRHAAYVCTLSSNGAIASKHIFTA